MKPFQQIFLVVFISIFCGNLWSQGPGYKVKMTSGLNSGLWKKFRHEFSLMGGASNFLGDLGGRNRVGSNFLWDLDFGKTSYAGGVSYSFLLAEFLGWRSQAMYTKVAGDDALTQESFRNNRNLNFESSIIEASTLFEVHFLREKIRNIYNLRSPTGKRLGLKSGGVGVYAFGGVGGFYYNPKAVTSGGKIPLRPLRTEGQGLSGGASSYSNFSVSFPVGFGVKKSFSPYMGFKFELTYRFTLTDYIDDVSTVYYSPVVLEQQLGETSAYLSNPSLGNKPTSVTAPGQQRGDPKNKDGFMTATVAIFLKIRTKSSSSGKNPSKKAKASF